MDEAKVLGEEIERSKEATSKVQTALQGLKRKLAEAEDDAAVEPSAAQRAQTLREMLAVEEPKLVLLFDEKRQRYELDFTRLKELKRELTHLEHGEKELEAAIKNEFSRWQRAVETRYGNTSLTPPAEKSMASTAEPQVQPQSNDAFAKAEQALATLQNRLAEARNA